MVLMRQPSRLVSPQRPLCAGKRLVRSRKPREIGGDGDFTRLMIWKIYKALYIDNMSEEDAASLMGYKTNEKNRVPGYKQIKNVKKAIIQKVKKMLKDGDIEIL